MWSSGGLEDTSADSTKRSEYEKEKENELGILEGEVSL